MGELKKNLSEEELNDWWESADYYTKEGAFNMFAPFDGTYKKVLVEADKRWSKLNLSEKNQIYSSNKK